MCQHSNSATFCFAILDFDADDVFHGDQLTKMFSDASGDLRALVPWLVASSLSCFSVTQLNQDETQGIDIAFSVIGLRIYIHVWHFVLCN